MLEKYKNLPLRTGVGVIILNEHNRVFVAKRIDNPKNFGKCHREEWIMVRIFIKQR